VDISYRYRKIHCTRLCGCAAAYWHHTVVCLSVCLWHSLSSVHLPELRGRVAARWLSNLCSTSFLAWLQCVVHSTAWHITHTNTHPLITTYQTVSFIKSYPAYTSSTSMDWFYGYLDLDTAHSHLASWHNAEQSIMVLAINRWLRACVKAKDEHFEYIPVIILFLHVTENNV